MPKYIGKYKCKFCEDIFETNGDNFSSCKCGRNEFKQGFSTTYKTDGNKGYYAKQLENKTFYYENEFMKLDDRNERLWSLIKNLEFNKLIFSIYTWEGKRNSADGKSYMSTLHYEISKTRDNYESDSIKFTYDLEQNTYSNNKQARLHKKLRDLYTLLLKVKTGKINISDRSMMIENYEYDKNQHDLFDYTFYV